MLKNKNITYSITISDKQNNELKEMFKVFECNSMGEFLTKMFEFAKILNKIYNKNWDCLLVDRNEIETIENDNKITMIFNNKNSYDFITDKISEIMNIKRKINETNIFGLQNDINIDEFKN